MNHKVLSIRDMTHKRKKKSQGHQSFVTNSSGPEVKQLWVKFGSLSNEYGSLGK